MELPALTYLAPFIRRSTSIVVFLASIGLLANAQDDNESTVGSAETKTYFFEAAGKDMEYALYVPATYDETKQHGLIVCLHMWKSKPSGIIKYDGIREGAEKRGYVVVAPYGYNERGWYGSQGEGKIAPWGEEEDDPPNLAELSEQDVMNVLEIAQKDFSIDPERIYLFGHAMGGGGAFHLGVTYPKIWAGIAAMSPQFYADPKVLRKSRHIPTILVTGDEDEHVKVEKVRLIVKQLERSKTKHRYIEIEEGDHYGSIANNPEMISQVFDFFEGKFAEEVKETGEVFRNFTNSEGKTIEANLITATKDDVTIKRKDGQRFTLPLASLSKEDQVYIEEWIESNAEKITKAALRAAADAEPDPELEAKLIAKLEIDRSEPEAAIEILSLEIEELEKQVNELDDKVVKAFRGGKKSTGRKYQIELLRMNEELKTLRAVQSDFKNSDSEGDE